MEVQRPPRIRGIGAFAAAGMALTVAGYSAGHPQPLGPSTVCPGLVELAAIMTLRASDSMAAANVLASANTILLALLTGAVTWLASSLAQNVALGAAVAGSLAVILVGMPGATPAALATALVAAVAFSILLGDTGARRDRVLAGLLPITSALLSAAALPAAIAAFVCWHSRLPRKPLFAWSALGCLAAPLIVTQLIPGLPGAVDVPIAQCVIPPTSFPVWSAARQSLALSAATAGAYMVTLALLGAFLVATERRRSARMLAALLYAAGVVLAEARPSAAPLPALVVFAALFAAIGLAQLLRSTTGRILAPVAAVFLVAVMPASALVRAAARPTASAEAGPESGPLSLRSLVDLLARAPAGARLVQEDAAVDLLLRAAAAEGVPPPAVVSRASSTIRDASQSAPIVAFPQAQRWLQNRGFELADVETTPGLAIAQPRGACRSLLPAWRRLSDLEASETFALVAETAADRGPVRLYAFFDEKPQLFSLDWPAESVPGFRWTEYAPGDKAASGDLIADQVPLGDLNPANMHILRLDQERSPGAPLALATTFHLRPRAVFGRLSEEAGRAALSVCPAYPHDVVAIAAKP